MVTRIISKIESKLLVLSLVLFKILIVDFFAYGVVPVSIQVYLSLCSEVSLGAIQDMSCSIGGLKRGLILTKHTLRPLRTLSALYTFFGLI